MPGLETSPRDSRKRKLNEDPPLEIDLSAPEPPSKKALRKAKKKSGTLQTSETSETQETTTIPEQTESAQTTTKPKSAETTTQKKPTKHQDVFGIWIGNLPFTATKADLCKFLTTNGSFNEDVITRIHMPEGQKQRDKKPRNKGFAYVDFLFKEIMEQAVALSERLLSGRRVLIKRANDFNGRPDDSQKDGNSKGGNAPVNPPSRRIFIGNLGFDVTKEMLEQHFSPCGIVSNLHMATFEDSGKCKGYAWAEFDEIESAQAAVRGFVEVKDSEGEDEEEEDENADMNNGSSSSEASGDESTDRTKPKSRNNQKKKKIWVNRVAGRHLRMEFAEDKTTRYNKRFGKEGAPKVRTNGAGDGQENTDEVPPIEEVSTQRSQFSTKKGKDRTQSKPKDSHGNRYSQDVVQRLSGAMVEPQGKKKTFD